MSGALRRAMRLAIVAVLALVTGCGPGGPSGFAVLGDWTLTAIISVESGFPVSVNNNTNTTQIFTRMQRSNPGTGEAETPGSDQDRYEPGLWLNANGFTVAPAFTLGTLPRNLDELRTPARNNIDFVASKGGTVELGSWAASGRAARRRAIMTESVRDPEAPERPGGVRGSGKGAWGTTR